MSLKKKPRKSRISDATRHKIIELASESSGKMSLKELSRKTGVSDKSVAHILNESPFRIKQKELTLVPPESEGKIVTLRTIAQEAGFSLGTVSLAMRDSHKISPKTKEKVLKAAKRLNYQKSPVVTKYMTAIRSGRIKKTYERLGYIVSGDRAMDVSILDAPWGPKKKYEAAKKKAYQLGYEVDLFDIEKIKKLDTHLHKIGIKGLLIDTPLSKLSEHSFNIDQFCAISFQKRESHPTHIIGHDLYNNTLLCFCKLWLSGYRRIGYISPDVVAKDTQFISNASFTHAQNHLTLPDLRIPILPLDTMARALSDRIEHGKLTESMCRESDYDRVKHVDWEPILRKVKHLHEPMSVYSYAVIENWLKTYKAEVVIWENKNAITILKQLGYQIPQDLSLVHLNLHNFTQGWAGIKRAEDLVSSIAVEQLCLKLESVHNNTIFKRTTQNITGEWKDGYTAPGIKTPVYPLTETADFWIKKCLPSILE